MKKSIFALLLAALLILGGIAVGEGRKVVYLTFDDGPKADTPELVALLKELDVPATFFFVGLGVRSQTENAKLVYESGYTIASHSMGHAPDIIREGGMDYVRFDLNRFNETMREYVDPTFSTDIFRFPGGSTSYSYKIRDGIVGEGFAWFDWSAMNGDAHFTFNNDDEMYNYTISTLHDQDVVILLMHEGKSRTRRVLVRLVEYFRANGYEFRTLSTSEEERAILANCSANMGLPELTPAN